MAQSAANPAGASPSFLVTGTFAGAKSPLVNGVIALINNQVCSFIAPTSTPLISTAPPASVGTPLGMCGDMSNGIAVFGSSGAAYLTGVGVQGANWYSLPSLPTPAGGTAAAITIMSGDLANGLVASDGTNLYSILFNGSSAEWTLLSAPPAGTIIDVGGDPTGGILLAIAQSGSAEPSSLFYGAGGCSCSWVGLTQSGTNLPVTKIEVSAVCGTQANGFVVFGENQLFTYTTKYTAATATAPASCAATSNKPGAGIPFAVTDLCGDATLGVTVLAAGSGLIANGGTAFTTWTVVTAVPPTSSGTPAAPWQ